MTVTDWKWTRLGEIPVMSKGMIPDPPDEDYVVANEESFEPDSPQQRANLARILAECGARIPTEFAEDHPWRDTPLPAYSFVQANREFREAIMDPGPKVDPGETTWKAWLPIAFATVPPVAGLFFKNGSRFFSDLILLCLASVFLHWSVVAPW
jgi:hypothetical protein